MSAAFWQAPRPVAANSTAQLIVCFSLRELALLELGRVRLLLTDLFAAPLAAMLAALLAALLTNRQSL